MSVTRLIDSRSNILEGELDSQSIRAYTPCIDALRFLAAFFHLRRGGPLNGLGLIEDYIEFSREVIESVRIFFIFHSHQVIESTDAGALMTGEAPRRSP